MGVQVELLNVALAFGARVGRYLKFDVVFRSEGEVVVLLTGCRTYNRKITGPATKLDSGKFMPVVGWGPKGYQMVYDAVVATQSYQDAVLGGLKPLQSIAEGLVISEHPPEILEALKPRKNKIMKTQDVPEEMFQ